MINELKGLGMSEKEAKIYVALLELGRSAVQSLARKANINRATTYIVLNKLMGMGLASKYDEGKKTYFVAESPERLSVLIEKEKVEIENKEKEMTRLIPQLRLLKQEMGEEGPVVRYFEGKEGLKIAVKEILNSTKGKKIRMFYNADVLLRFFSKEERVEFKNIRSKRKINTEVIYASDLTNLPEKSDGDVRIKVSIKEFPSECDIAIYDDKVRIASFAKKNPVGIIIKDKSIQEAFLSLFKLAWKGARVKK